MKYHFLRQINVFLFFMMFFEIFVCINSSAGLLPKKILFRIVDEKLQMVKIKKADIYIPQTFKDGMEYYKDAEEMYNDKENQKDIKKTISKAIKKFEKCIDDFKVASVFFTKTIVAREDALKAKADLYDNEMWKNAEEKFKDAAETLEDGDTNDSKETSKEAEKLYRDAELKAIQSKYLKNVWSLIKKAENNSVVDYAPATFEKSIKLSKKSASLLHLHRYDQEEAIKASLQAEYEARHSIYLGKKIKDLKETDNNMEDVFLMSEKPLIKISSTLGIESKFDNGIDPPLNNIIASINILKKENKDLSNSLNKIKDLYSKTTIEKNIQISSLKAQLTSLENQLTELNSAKELLKTTVRKNQIRKEKISRISSSILPSEGKVLIDGNNVILRLYGLTFPMGKAVIEPQYFALLSKVKKAFAEFQGCKITIEGHTDSSGGEETNQKLSEERAGAVRQYILANSNIGVDRIHAIGFGESRPVASNETAEGQAKNRRIDVVIQP